MSYIRVGLQGTLPGGEVWSVNPAFNETTNVTTWDQSAGQTAANSISALSLPSALNALKSTAAGLSRVRVERRSDAGALLGAAEAGWAGGGSGASAPVHPPQTSIVFSLRSNVPGSRGRGRLYWPAIGATLSSSTLRLATPTTSDAATAAAGYLDQIATALKVALAPSPSLIDYDLCVVSPTSGTRTKVVRIQVGDILDVQRRRRDRLVETYASAAMP